MVFIISGSAAREERKIIGADITHRKFEWQPQLVHRALGEICVNILDILPLERAGPTAVVVEQEGKRRARQRALHLGGIQVGLQNLVIK